MFLPGIEVATKEDLNQVSWDFILFMAGCLAIGNVGGEIGIGQIVANFLLPFLEGKGIVFFVVAVFIVGVLANLAMTPFAMMTLLVVPLGALAVQLGHGGLPFIYTMVQALDGIIFPYETTFFLIAFSFGLLKMNDFVKVFGLKVVLTAVYLGAIAVPYWNLIGLI